MLSFTEIAHSFDEDGPLVVACLPAGASNNHYRTIWPEPRQPMNIVEAPPAREFLPDVCSSVESFVNSLRGWLPCSRTVTVFGHSLGGSIALAISHYLKEYCDVTPRVVLSAVPSPGSSSLNAGAASDFILESLSDFIPPEFEVPDSFLGLINRFVEQDFKAAGLLSEFGRGSLARVVGFISGCSDPLCRDEDIRWWKEVSPSLELSRFEGGHFGYMSSKIKMQYQAFIQHIAMP